MSLSGWIGRGRREEPSLPRRVRTGGPFSV
jgi:hypothetical protein